MSRPRPLIRQMDRAQLEARLAHYERLYREIQEPDTKSKMADVIAVCKRLLDREAEKTDATTI